MHQATPGAAAPATRWWLLACASVAIFGNYYVYDSIAPIAEMLSRELGFSDTQIGSLNAVYHLPNIFLVLIGGLLVDRFGAGRVAFATGVLFASGAALTAATGDYPVMIIGRLLYGIGSETFLVAISVAIGIRFGGHVVAFAMALNLSLGRLGSYVADISPLWAGGVYELGWQPPLYLATAFGVVGLLGTAGCWWLDKYRPALVISRDEPVPGADRFHWRDLFGFDRSYWYVAALGILFYSVIFPFRSTFAIKYFQDAHGMTLEQAALTNSYVFLSAIVLTPLFGLIADRYGRRGLQMMLGSALLPLSFVGLFIEGWGEWATSAMLGISFSLIPAILWPAVVKLVPARRLGTAYGLMFMGQAVGMSLANLVAGFLNDSYAASAANPAGYGPMLVFFGLVAAGALVFAVALWQRERGPHGHGLELPR